MPTPYWLFLCASSCAVTGALCYFWGECSRKQPATCRECPVLRMARQMFWYPRSEYLREELAKVIQFQMGK